MLCGRLKYKQKGYKGMGYEEIARANHRSGNNCSVSLFKAFADKMGMSEAEAARIAPPPRSEGGKCGGFLAGRKLLEMLKPEVVEEFEKCFLEQNGDNKCASLILKRRLQGKNCNDLVGETASIIESMI
jgi:hypothetical protein